MTYLGKNGFPWGVGEGGGGLGGRGELYRLTTKRTSSKTVFKVFPNTLRASFLSLPASGKSITILYYTTKNVYF